MTHLKTLFAVPLAALGALADTFASPQVALAGVQQSKMPFTGNVKARMTDLGHGHRDENKLAQMRGDHVDNTGLSARDEDTETALRSDGAAVYSKQVRHLPGTWASDAVNSAMDGEPQQTQQRCWRKRSPLGVSAQRTDFIQNNNNICGKIILWKKVLPFGSFFHYKTINYWFYLFFTYKYCI